MEEGSVKLWKPLEGEHRVGGRGKAEALRCNHWRNQHVSRRIVKQSHTHTHTHEDKCLGLGPGTYNKDVRFTHALASLNVWEQDLIQATCECFVQG